MAARKVHRGHKQYLVFGRSHARTTYNLFNERHPDRTTQFSAHAAARRVGQTINSYGGYRTGLQNRFPLYRSYRLRSREPAAPACCFTRTDKRDLPIGQRTFPQHNSWHLSLSTETHAVPLKLSAHLKFIIKYAPEAYRVALLPEGAARRSKMETSR